MDDTTLCIHCTRPIVLGVVPGTGWVHEGTEARRCSEYPQATPPEQHTALVRYAVIRFASDYPENWQPAHLDGYWFHIDDMSPVHPFTDEPTATARPTGRYEAREDGEIAEIYEFSVPPEQSGEALKSKAVK